MEHTKNFMKTSSSREVLDATHELEECEGELPDPESVDELRERLEQMKRMMNERPKAHDPPPLFKNASSIIDGNFLSLMFAGTLVVILVVSIYAFYNLFWAIWKRNARYHEEL